MTQRINDHQALDSAAYDLQYIGEEIIFQLNMLVSESNGLRERWNDPQYAYFVQRMDEVLDSMKAYHEKNLMTVDAVRHTAELIRRYLSTQ
jgi:hypothetical protein